ncbi:Transglutaminase-like superfamily protein [Botrimarina colliarenosi]|uniref:Transglutaminase-like superfamily protein n=1 Tax=Botrimarina colliarenosi TaxID=2528001 RepID=A0A5C5ZZ20_9BACT|nr:transglutaminase domain-containing protein [Botrimarina colliarenosi]TWT92330.1 Transglutaminase-like superfamily protein [Botrimarina colliarenosi]
MPCRFPLLGLALLGATVPALFSPNASAQLLDAPVPYTAGYASETPEAPEEPVETTVRFRVGTVITAKRGACRDILAMVAVPIECAEQHVRLVEEDFSPGVKATFRDLAGGNARQMLVSIPFLDAGAEGRAILTYEVTTRTTLPPSEADEAQYVIPRRVPRGLRGYIGPSPFIESKHPKIKRLAREIEDELEEAEAAPSDWRRVEALYDYVMDHVEYLEGPDTSALTSLEAGSADCHGRSALFAALCRASGVPARMVWVNEHAYPEFYLQRGEDDEEGVWLPAESAGTRAFGEMPIARPILQKGDDFRVPEKRESLRYVTDYLIAYPATRGAGKPSVQYLREIVQ